MLPAGAVIGGEYRLVRLLGRGGMGEVYEAVHERMQRKVALKTVRADVALDPAALARFRREAETAASLGHPNIVQVTDFQSPPGQPAFLVMEHLEGRALGEVIEQERKIAPARAAFIGMQLLSGLAAAHAAGIVHRDIKPGNVFLLSTFAVRDLVKIVDFGIAKMVVDVAATSQRKLTDFGQVLGTFAYMAPEQAMGGDVDARADIFAVGATLFHALSGVRPTEAIVPGHARVSLANMAPWIDPKLAAIVDRAMERSPSMRFGTAQEMADALAPFADEEPAPGSMTVPDGASLRADVGDRFSAETRSTDAEGVPPTVSFGGTQPLAAPIRISQSPPVSGPTAPPAPRASYNPPISAPHPVPWTPPASPNRAIAIFVALFAGSIVLAGACGVVHVLGGTGARSTNVEQSWLDNAKLKPCPSNERCTKEKAGTVTYPVCTKESALGALGVGDLVLVKTPARTYAGYVASPSEDARHYVVKQVIGEEADDVTVDQLSRLCR